MPAMKILPPYIVESDAVSTAASALSAQRIRMNMIANNLANLQTTRNDKGEFAPYLRKHVLFQTEKVNPEMPDNQGVKVHEIVESKGKLRSIYDPNHPEANKDGYRFEPNVKLPLEMINMIEASRAYDSNLRAMKIASSSKGKTVSILDRPLP
jgi:flagellar basal-body rod protein FlgC